MDLERHRQKALQKKKEHRDFFKELRKWKPQRLDASFHTYHEEVFEEIDCLTCANCCKTTSPMFLPKDIERLAKYFKIRPAQFIEQYLHEDDEGDYVLNSAPCPFLGHDNYCSVYDHRPKACREYPHTNRKKMRQLLPLTLKNIEVCPAVFEMVERMKREK